MKWQQGATNINIADIWVARDDRQRRNFETSDLEFSITKRGLMNPIIISPSSNPDFLWELKAGERRLTACKKLGHEKILARKVSDLDPIEAQIIELEENVKRLDLEWQDAVSGVAKIHSLFLQTDPDWTRVKTATECGLSEGVVSMYMSVWEEFDNPKIREAGTAREAYNLLKRRNQRQAGAALQELLEAGDVVPTEPTVELTPAQQQEVKVLKELGEPLPPHLKVAPKPKPVPAPVYPESILHTSFLDWAPKYEGQKFNLIHCDFPYGVDLFSGPQGRGAELGESGRVGYKDTPDVYWELVRSLCSNLNRVMSASAHLMFWLSADYRIISETIKLFNELAPSLVFQKFPLIWSKSDNAGIASDSRMGPRHTYEACLMATRGSRQIAKVKSDAYHSPTNKDLHPSTKPEPMLRHFMEMLVDESTTLLDPTCGSGASLRAAESLGAKQVLGLEIDKQFVDPARLALKQSRAKRLAERGSSL